MPLQGAYLVTKKVNADGVSPRAEINAEAFGVFCQAISPPSKSFLFICTQNLELSCKVIHYLKAVSHPLFYIKELNFSQKENGGLFLLISSENGSPQKSHSLFWESRGSVKVLLHRAAWTSAGFRRAQAGKFS